MASRLRQIRHGWPQKIETRERESGLHTQGDARGQKGGGERGKRLDLYDEGGESVSPRIISYA